MPPACSFRALSSFCYIRVVACPERSLQPLFLLRWHAVASPEWRLRGKSCSSMACFCVSRSNSENGFVFNCVLLHVESGRFEHGVVFQRRVCACQVPLHVKSGNFEHGAFLQRHAVACQERPFRACSGFSIACPCNIENEVDKECCYYFGAFANVHANTPARGTA